MDASDAIQVLILIFLIACSAFFSSSETAMTTVSKIRVRNLAEGGDRRAILLSRLIEEPGKMLSAILTVSYTHLYRAIGSNRFIDLRTLDETDETVFNSIYYKEIPVVTGNMDETLIVTLSLIHI